MNTKGRIKAILGCVVLGVLAVIFAATVQPTVSNAKTPSAFSQLVITPKAISFGKVVSEATYFMIENSGNAPLIIDSISLAPTNAFSVLSAPANGDTLGPKSFDIVLLSFQPPAPGNYVATVTVNTNASKGSASSSVALRGVGPNVAVYPTSTPIQTATPAPTPSNGPLISSLSPGAAITGSGDFVLDVTGLNFTASAIVNWNGNALLTTFLSPTELTASISAADVSAIGTRFITVSVPELGTSDPATFLVGAEGGPGFAELVINRQANDLVYDPLRQVIYLSVPGGANGAISVVDLARGAIKSSTIAGSDPDVLSMSNDAKYLYAGLDGVSSVQRFVLPTLAKDISFKLGRDPFYGPYYALDLQVAPGQPHTIAVSRGAMGVSPRSLGGVVIFDNATARPAVLEANGSSYDSLTWGADADELYAEDNEDTGFDFYTMSVDQSGVTLDRNYELTFSGFNGRIHFDQATGLVYSDTGNVVDPSNGNPAGRFPAKGPMVPDSTSNKAFFVVSTSSPTTVQSYSLTQFWFMNSIPLLDVTTKPLRIIRWGSNGIAFNTQDGPTYVIAGTFVH